DDLWHRLFGLDVTLWSPPHLLGLLGAAINTLGCFCIAREVYPARSRAGFAAQVGTGTILFIGLHFALQPAFRIAYLHGGVLFHFYAMLASLVLPVAFITTARLTGVRWAPLLVMVGAVALGLLALMAVRLASLPAFRPIVPEGGATLVALGLTLVAGVVGGWVASRIAATLGPPPRSVTS